jgi:cytochrome d ubiquinol oxidase subunit II
MFFYHQVMPILAGAVAAFVVLCYVVLDGFDLGVGIMFAVERDWNCRSLMISSILPIWDGNETWLILGVASILALFPLAAAVLLPAIYVLIVSMLMGLIFRGVAIEFRTRSTSDFMRAVWDTGFMVGSFIAAFCQGATLGAVMQGIKIAPGPYGGHFGGGPFSWLSWFSVFTGFAVIIGYALLGSTWMVWRATGEIQQRMQKWAATFTVAMIPLMLGVSIWTQFLNDRYYHRWFTWPSAILTVLAPVAVLGSIGILFYFLRRIGKLKYDVIPFVCAIILFAVAFAGVGFTLYPVILPPSLTIWQAAAPPYTQAFMLVGDALLIPVLLFYNSFAVYVFHGKVESEHLEEY